MDLSWLRRVVLPLLVGCLLGGWVAGAVAFRYARGPYAWMGAVAWSAWRAENAYRMYREADETEARKALQSHIEYLSSLLTTVREWEPGQYPFISPESVTFDIALTAGRLALLEEGAGNAEAAEEAWSECETWMRQGSWREPTRTRMRWFLNEVDGDWTLPPQRGGE